MEDIEHKIDILKQLLYTKIDSNNNIISAEILRLSQELDELIVEAYKKQLNLT
ncbi:aspartyl-phosphate phosphatase Spo0E family protein [Clostridium pasteurianum]|uniref:aspartyl-phosphate phosphatase Spo0E family protein n=1 Tax=Clostridium pasteurianum TaxID=1501 RepID=UPI002260C1C5|nr:aspartyl-phosphate phosphatase Spo0E family protein [Clostridium pasteurianum]UZW13066.1 aspartyl-phosphate phosphatase Spo0E family protein [Clostridium pasteurianum]